MATRSRWIPAAAICGSTALLFAIAVLPFQTRRSLADGNFYIGTMHSLYVDGDVDLRNEADFYPWLKYYTLEAPPPPHGLRNPFPIGTSLAWMPFYAAFDGLDRLLGGRGVDETTGPRAGPAYFATSWWVATGLFAVAATLRRLGARRRECVAIGAIVLCLTPLPAYLTFAPDMSHGVAFAVAAVLLWTCVRLRQDAAADSPRWMLAGLVAGAAFLVRWQDGTLAVLPALLLLRWRGVPLRQRAVGVAWLAAGALPPVLPQLVAWKSVYGTWLLLPGEPEHLGSGGGFLGLANAEPLAFFFSTWNGAFLCHPVLLVCAIGLAMRGAGEPRREMPGLRLAAGVAVAVHVASSMIVADWWSGGSFGQRRFVSLLPLLALGLHALWPRLVRSRAATRAGVAAAVLLLGVWNGLSLYRLHERSLPYNPADVVWYPSERIYGYYDYGRRFRDVLLGAVPTATPTPRGWLHRKDSKKGSKERE